jgi:rRNA-processing protein FCF1
MTPDEALPKLLLVDTNALILYLVGQSDQALISRFKRTNKYNVADFEHLRNVIQRFGRIGRVVTTPHVLAEVSNLAGQLAEPGRTRVFRVLAAIIPELDERHAPARDFYESPEFVKIGIADTAITNLVDSDYLVLTDDYRLAGTLSARGVQALNFNQFRLRRLLNE